MTKAVATNVYLFLFTHPKDSYPRTNKAWSFPTASLSVINLEHVHGETKAQQEPVNYVKQMENQSVNGIFALGVVTNTCTFFLRYSPLFGYCWERFTLTWKTILKSCIIRDARSFDLLLLQLSHNTQKQTIIPERLLILQLFVKIFKEFAIFSMRLK